MSSKSDTINEQLKLYIKPIFGYYIIKGKGEGGVSLFLKKSPLLWLARLILFFEWNPYVLDEEGAPIIFNKINLMEQFVKGNIRYNANVSWVDFTNMSKDRYEEYWLGKGLTPEKIKNDKINNIWPYPYHLQFHLEKPLSRRIIVPFWTP